MTEIINLLTLFPTAYFSFKIHLEYLSQILVYLVTYKYINSLNPKGQVSSFKTLEMWAAQSSAACLKNSSKQK